MLWVTSLSLVLPPLEVVPMAMLFEVATSLHLLPAIRRQIDWRSVRLLLVGTLVATPVGVYALSSLPPGPARIGVATTVLVATAMLGYGFALSKVPGSAATLCIGFLAGILNGSMGFVGPVVIIFYLSSPIAITISRASIITFFLGTGTAGAATFAVQGLITPDILVRLAAFLPIVLIGNWVGHRRFTDTPAGVVPPLRPRPSHRPLPGPHRPAPSGSRAPAAAVLGASGERGEAHADGPPVDQIWTRPA